MFLPKARVAVLAQEVDDLAVPFVSEHEWIREKRARTIKDKTFCTGYRKRSTEPLYPASLVSM
jgi:hypothetical protein